MKLTADRLRASVTEVNRWRRGDSFAPHKPLTLLYALGRVARGEPRLVPFAEARELLKSLIRDFGPPQASIHPEYPYQRLANDGLWELLPTNLVPRKSNTDASTGTLLKANAKAGFTDEVQALLVATPDLVGELADNILVACFPETLHDAIRAAVGLAKEVLVSKQSSARDPRFRLEVLRAYGYRCAVCGFDLQLDTVPLAIEAAHIKWHQWGGPPSVRNGLALCSVHHAVFDRGAFSITVDFRVTVATGVSRSDSAKEWMWKYDGKPVSLPPRDDLLPAPDFVRWHHGNVFRGRTRA